MQPWPTVHRFPPSDYLTGVHITPREATMSKRDLHLAPWTASASRHFKSERDGVGSCINIVIAG